VEPFCVGANPDRHAAVFSARALHRRSPETTYQSAWSAFLSGMAAGAVEGMKPIHTTGPARPVRVGLLGDFMPCHWSPGLLGIRSSRRWGRLSPNVRAAGCRRGAGARRGRRPRIGVADAFELGQSHRRQASATRASRGWPLCTSRSPMISSLAAAAMRTGVPARRPAGLRSTGRFRDDRPPRLGQPLGRLAAAPRCLSRRPVAVEHL